jgi:hypothetical protein
MNERVIETIPPIRNLMPIILKPSPSSLGETTREAWCLGYTLLGFFIIRRDRLGQGEGTTGNTQYTVMIPYST